MKAKMTANLMKPKTTEVLLKVDQVVEFTIVEGKEGKKNCKIEGCPMVVPINTLAKHAQFAKNTKEELVKMGLIEAEPAAQPATEEKKEAPSSEKKPTQNLQSAVQVPATGLCAAIINMNGICKGNLLGMHITRVDNECIEGDITFLSTKLPPVNFSIGVGDFTTGKLEQEVAQFIDDHNQTITNKLEIIEQLDEQIKARQEELQAAKTEKAPTAKAEKPAAKKESSAKATKPVAKKEEEPAKPADLFEAASAEEEASDDFEDDGDLEQPGTGNQVDANPVDDGEFED